MKVEIRGLVCVVTREPGDPVFRNGGWAGQRAAESRLLYHVKRALNRGENDFIKKSMAKDGHLVDDRQQYLRTRSPTSPGLNAAIYDDRYATRNSAFDFNERGEVTFAVVHDVWTRTTQATGERPHPRHTEKHPLALLFRRNDENSG